MKRTLGLALILAVAACGGSGNGSSSSTPPGSSAALTVVDPTYGTIYISPDGAENPITDASQIAQNNVVIQNVQQIFGFTDDMMKESLSRLIIKQLTSSAYANIPWQVDGGGAVQVTKETAGRDALVEARTFVAPNGCVFDAQFALGLANYLWCDQNYYRVRGPGAPAGSAGQMCPLAGNHYTGVMKDMVLGLSDSQISALLARFSTVTLCTRPPYTGNG